jgi:hypothetical protein
MILIGKVKTIHLEMPDCGRKSIPENFLRSLGYCPPFFPCFRFSGFAFELGRAILWKSPVSK